VTSRFVSVEFEIGLFIGLAGILVCSFLGGMRAVTWTQVAQYVILIIAYLVPVVILSYKLTGIPIPQAVYGTVLQQISAREDELLEAPTERAVRDLYSARARDYADKIAALPASLEDERRRMIDELNRMRLDSAPARDIALTERALRDLPRTPAEAREAWQRARAEALERARPPPRHAEAHPGATASESATARNNFLALMFVLMVGTAALPHILMRYYTTPGVMEARRSVLWSLFFIFLLYVTAPAYAVFAKWEVYNNLVGSNIAILPDWVASWGRVGLVRIEDLNGDGILQLAELRLNTDVIVLATPEIAGLPYVVSGLVAAGGLAAALSTADGLLLTISNALSHDLYYKVINPKASAHRRLVISKSQLLVVAVVAAWVASMRPDNILFMVGLAFSIGGSAFFPALVLGIFWKRANRPGAVAGMLAGLAVTVFYVVRTHPFFHALRQAHHQVPAGPRRCPEPRGGQRPAVHRAAAPAAGAARTGRRRHASLLQRAGVNVPALKKRSPRPIKRLPKVSRARRRGQSGATWATCSTSPTRKRRSAATSSSPARCSCSPWPRTRARPAAC
jgi:cation/acetate symporter